MTRYIVLAIFVVNFVTAACTAQTHKDNSSSLPFREIRLRLASHPTMPAMADVNKDGNLDIIVPNGGGISVFLGDGKGGFAQVDGSPFASGQTGADIGLADFNGDGNPDVALANHGVKTAEILLGNGNGQFSLAPGSPFSVESNPHPHGIAVADFNHDGRADIAIDSWAENKVLMLFGKGDGTVQQPGVKFDVGKMPYQRLRCADVNDDGNGDIVTSDFESSSVTVLLGDGKGGFVRKDFPVPPDPFGIAIADVNGDKHLDIVISHYSGQLVDPSKNAMSVLLGDGKVNFTLAKGSPFPTGNYPGTIATGDLNGDGIADIVVPNYEDGTLTVYLCTANSIALAAYSPIKVAHAPHGVTIADLNHDGKGDIVVTEEEDNDLLVLLSK